MFQVDWRHKSPDCCDSVCVCVQVLLIERSTRAAAASKASIRLLTKKATAKPCQMWPLPVLLFPFAAAAAATFCCNLLYVLCFSFCGLRCEKWMRNNNPNAIRFDLSEFYSKNFLLRFHLESNSARKITKFIC